MIAAAKRKLELLEREHGAHPAAQPSGAPQQPDLFAVAAAPSPALLRLDEIDPDQLTPRQALDLLYELKGLSEIGG